jgi:hypothetical protein
MCRNSQGFEGISKAMLLILLAAMPVAAPACGGDGGKNTGSLEFKVVLARNQAAAAALGQSKDALVYKACAFQDMTFLFRSLQVSTGTPAEGLKDDFKWETVYQGTQETAISQLSIVADLPVGTYGAMKMSMRNLNYWVLDCTGAGKISIPSLNDSKLAPEADAPTSVLTPNGNWRYNADNTFKMQTPGETMGAFEIRQGKKTRLTWVINFNTADFDDKDGNGKWSDGDVLDFNTLTLAPGKTTMFDFKVEYL